MGWWGAAAAAASAGTAAAPAAAARAQIGPALSKALALLCVGSLGFVDALCDCCVMGAFTKAQLVGGCAKCLLRALRYGCVAGERTLSDAIMRSGFKAAAFSRL